MVRGWIWLTGSRVTVVYQSTRWVTSNLMILMASFLPLSLRWCTSRIWIISGLLAYSFMIHNMWSSAAITWNLFRSASSINTRCLNRPPFPFDLIKALLSILLVDMFHSLNDRVLVSYHAFTKHWRWSICVVRVLAVHYLLVLFGVNLSFVLSLNCSPLSKMTSIGSLVNAKAHTNCGTRTWGPCAQLIRPHYWIARPWGQAYDWPYLMLIIELLMWVCSRCGEHLMNRISSVSSSILRHCS